MDPHQTVVTGPGGDVSDDSLSKWPPSGQQKLSLRQGLYTSFNKDIFQDTSAKPPQLTQLKSELMKEQDIWSSMEYPPSPKDAFQETCDFYDDQMYARRKGYSRQYPGMMNGYGNGRLVGNGVTKSFRAKPRHLDFYKSDSKLTHHQFADQSSADENDYLSNPSVLGRSKSLHDLERSKTPSKQESRKQTEQIGLSEHDLNRARSVLGLPLTSEPYTTVFQDGFDQEAEDGAEVVHDSEKTELDLGYDSQPGSNRNSLNVSVVFY